MSTDLVISGLLNEREALRGRIRDHEEQASIGREALRHLDATLRHLGYHDPCLKYHAPKKKLQPGAFYKGELPRMVMRALHTHPDDRTQRDIAGVICKEKGWDIENRACTRRVLTVWHGY
ncbi:MAG: hypothetical protein ACWA5L_07215 [bacterium]